MPAKPCKVRSTRPVLRAALWGCAAAAALLAAVPPASAQPIDPTGDWMVERGLAVIRIVDCEGHLWGVVAWEKLPGVDRYNPDPRKRNRPTLGMPTLLDMRRVAVNEWDGHVYNSNDGRTYSAQIALASANMLKVRGCVLGFLCGGQNWTRVPPDNAAAGTIPSPHPAPTAPPAPSARSKPSTPSARAKTSGQAAQAAQPPDDVCSTILGVPGTPHEGGLK